MSELSMTGCDVIFRLPCRYRWVHDSENWLKSEGDEEPVLCGNVTGAR
jgi:hypothetical protein